LRVIHEGLDDNISFYHINKTLYVTFYNDMLLVNKEKYR